jgi:hypothetical protein
MMLFYSLFKSHVDIHLDLVPCDTPKAVLLSGSRAATGEMALSLAQFQR